MSMIRLTTRSQGFTLLEVLIALLVLAIGLLGMASLMLTSIQSNQGAAQRSAAVVLSYDLIERMRSNRAEAETYVLQLDDPASLGLPASECYLPDDLDGCTSEETVAYDTAVWWAAAQDAIPGIEANGVELISLGGNDYQITLTWPAAGLDGDESYSVVVTL